MGLLKLKCDLIGDRVVIRQAGIILLFSLPILSRLLN
jgi:hypothetical protein